MKKPNILVAATFAFAVSSLPAHAYLDPGTGSLIVQSLIGGFLAASTFVAVYINKIKEIFRRLAHRAGPEGKDPE